MRGVWGVAIIVICVGAGIYVLFAEGEKKEERREKLRKRLTRYYFCDACSEEFLDEGGRKAVSCPECKGSTSIVRVKVRCTRKDCGHEFVQYEVHAVKNWLREAGGDWGDRVKVDDPCEICGSKDLLFLPEQE